jgi:beta-lactamase class A
MEKLKKMFGKKIFLVIIFLVLGFSVGFFLRIYFFNKCSDQFSLMNPVFACIRSQTINKKGYTDLKATLTSYIDDEQKAGRVEIVAVFFRDLIGGPTLGINDRVDFIPASLLKLPVVLTIYRWAEEEDPNILSQELMFDNKTLLQNNQEFPPEQMIQVNTPYTVEELVEHTIKYSDNFAAELLVEHINNLGNGRDLIADTYRDLGILNSNDLDSSSVSAKGFSSIFTLLFNNSFLVKEDSEKILEILSENNFDEGLKAGVPGEIKVANKFGEREVTSTGEKQLHDCGIIYYPTNPYLLCVMTKGKDIADLKNIISHISEEFYKEIDSRKLISGGQILDKNI